jgi:membrane-bound lytic murein transglycosylase F
VTPGGEEIVPAASEAKEVRDLPAIRASGVLRALVAERDPEALVSSTAATPDREAVRALAQSLGLHLRFVLVPSRPELVAALLAGQGDVVADGLAAAPGATLSKALRHVDIVAVTKKPAAGEKKPAGRRPAAVLLPSAELPVQGAATGFEAAAALALQSVDDVAPLAERLVAGEALAFVGERDLWQANHGLSEQQAAGLQVAVLIERAPLGLATAPAAKELGAAVDAFVYQRSLTAYQSLASSGDLDAIRKRGVIRVAMLNNGASYFIYRGREVGFQYELASLLAARLGVRLQVVVPDKPDGLLGLLDKGLADVVPFAGTPQDASKVLLSAPFVFANQVLVQKQGSAAITRPEDLAGQTIHARAGSVYAPMLRELQAKVPALRVVWADEQLETEDLIDQVGRGEIPLTVSNSVLLAAELTWRDDVQGTLVLATQVPLAYAARTDAPALHERLEKFVTHDAQGAAGRELFAKYFENAKRMRELAGEDVSRSGRISPWDDAAKKYGQQYGVDWRLVLAQMYQESRFDPRAKSWVGAVGLLQLLPRTAKELGVNAHDPEQNIAGGVRYLAALMGRLEPGLDVRQRARMALAAYNAGFEHLRDARRLARQKGLDDGRWFGQVEQAMLLLEKPQYYARARFGYCRGREPVAYVSSIQAKYEAYVAALSATGGAH